MKAIVLQEPGKLALSQSAEATRPGAGEALVRVHRVGICGTDYHAFRGKQPFFSYPRIIGHELGVEVLEVGAGVAHVRPGDRCCVEPYFNCGQCIACRNGKGNCCTNIKVFGVHIDGGLRERVVVPANKLHKSEKLSYEQLALVEMLGIGAHAVARAEIRVSEAALVIGAGPIGLATATFAKAAGARVIVADINAQRLEFCRKQLGISDTLCGGDLAAEAGRLTGGDFPTAVFDATGNPQSMMGAFKCVAHGGRLVFVGLFQGEVTFNDPEFHRREMTLMGSRNSLPSDFRHIIGLMESGTVDTRPWITHRAGCEEMVGRFEGWLRPEENVVKAMVEF